VNEGNDSNPGTLDLPFRTLDKALQTVAQRVQNGIFSDKIYLRAGTYRKKSDKTLYHLKLKGTPDDYALLSAMPCESGTPDCIQRKSGEWYEKVVFDDAWKINTAWERVQGEENIWKTKPGYTNLEWTHQNLWPWTRTEKGFSLTDQDVTPETTLFTVAPYMVLQDGEPTVWVDSVGAISEQGMRTYNHGTGELFVWPYGDANPHDVKWESWYGGPEDYEPGTLHLDGEGRAIFKGDLEYVAIRGFEFYMFNKIFEFNRRKIVSEEERDIQKHVIVDDNDFRYGWIHILLDGNTVNQVQKEVLLPRYDDRSHWTVRNNVYYRPSRECFQLHGDNHIFEFNDIIERNGPWAGPAACVSCVNTRNTRNAIIRNNYIYKHGKTRYHRGSVFMIEVGHGSKPATGKASHMNQSGDYIFGGQTYENNVFEDVSGPVMVLGKGGGVRMQDITVRNNIFKSVKKGDAIRISSPHKNLSIENNIFYDLESAIALPGSDYRMSYQALPSSISIRGNIFAMTEETIDSALLFPHPNSNINIGSNLFYNNDQAPIGEWPEEANPDFRLPDRLDFRPQKSVNTQHPYRYFGPYPSDGSFEPGMDWWNRIPKVRSRWMD